MNTHAHTHLTSRTAAVQVPLSPHPSPDLTLLPGSQLSLMVHILL